MSDVYFLKCDYAGLLKTPGLLLKGLEQSGLLATVKPGDFTALKIHFGEQGNKSYINPNFLIPLARHLRSNLKAKPFFFETNTLYHGQRMNAIDHTNLAFGHQFGKVNLPIIIADGLKGNDYIEVAVNQKHFQTCYLAAALKEVDCILALSHFTGHMLTGFGCAIKNLGMGCAARRGKLAQHCMVSPVILDKRCVSCGLCSQNCPAKAIEKGAACLPAGRVCYVVNKEKCIGCAQCLSVCSHQAVNIVWSEDATTISERLAEYALAVVKGRRCLYVNFALYITQECDCMNKEDRGFAADLGLFFSRDPVAADKACVDMILRQEGRDAIKEIHPHINYMHGLEYAQKIGLGSLEYRLVEIRLEA
jgi:hypothetical protein